MTAIHFHVHKIGLLTDIEKAFLHVKLDAGDQDFTHFLWLSHLNDAESDFDIYHFKVVLFGSASFPFMLGATLHLYLSKYNSQIDYDTQQNLYVDNVISEVLLKNQLFSISMKQENSCLMPTLISEVGHSTANTYKLLNGTTKLLMRTD